MLTKKLYEQATGRSQKSHKQRDRGKHHFEQKPHIEHHPSFFRPNYKGIGYCLARMSTVM